MEEWRIIREYPRYSISNMGRVKNNKTGRVLKHSLVNGYPVVKLNNTHNYKIHRLVAKYFIANPDNLPQVNHKDRNRQNNIVENLEWCNNQYNSIYSLGKKVLQLDADGTVIKEYQCAKDAARAFGIDEHIILGCCRNNTGFNFKYK